MTQPKIDVDAEGGLRCPLCSFATSVKDSRPGTANTIRRRRMCLASRCGYRFTTYEVLLDDRQPVNAESFGILVDRSKVFADGMLEMITDLQTALATSRKMEKIRRGE